MDLISLLKSLFTRELEAVEKKVGQIPADTAKSFESVMVLVRKDIPDSVLIGGWALRLHLRLGNLPMPGTPYRQDFLDLDYALNPSRYEWLYAALKDKSINDSKQVAEHFSLKNEDPSTIHDHFAIENIHDDPIQRKHIEMFSRQGTESWAATSVMVNDTPITVISPEELLIMRIRKMKYYTDNQSNTIEMPVKHLYYLYLTSKIMNNTTIASAWNREFPDSDWQTEVQRYLKHIRTLIDEKRLVLVEKVA
jgi:hypothetical protein